MQCAQDRRMIGATVNCCVVRGTLDGCSGPLSRAVYIRAIMGGRHFATGSHINQTTSKQSYRAYMYL